MSRLTWDDTGKRLYETGTKMGVLYPQSDDGTYPKGVAWNGLMSVNESPSGAEASPLYANDAKYLELYSNEDFGFTIGAYTYPEEFAACDGSAELISESGVYVGQQPRKVFGLTYRTVVGNDVKGSDYGYKLHLVYGAKASPSEKGYSSINDSPEAVEFSWECTTTPINIEGFKPAAHIEIDSTKIKPEKLKKIEDALYGTNAVGDSGTGTEPKLLLPNEIVAILNEK
nr:MAG TPA: tail tube protein [Bacteriophage sp.]